jgi:hypothetical protein
MLLKEVTSIQLLLCQSSLIFRGRFRFYPSPEQSFLSDAPSWCFSQTHRRLLCSPVRTILRHVFCVFTWVACSRLSTVQCEPTISPDSPLRRDMFDQVHLYNPYSVTTTVPVQLRLDIVFDFARCFTSLENR